MQGKEGHHTYMVGGKIKTRHQCRGTVAPAPKYLADLNAASRSPLVRLQGKSRGMLFDVRDKGGTSIGFLGWVSKLEVGWAPYEGRDMPLLNNILRNTKDWTGNFQLMIAG